MIFNFREIDPNEFQSAYAILCESARWLKKHAFPYYIVPEEHYYARTVAGENFGLYREATLCAVASLSQSFPVIWGTYISHNNMVWLASLASLRTDDQRGYGKALVKHIAHYASLRKIDAIYLDCYFGNGTLPRYYHQLGYEYLHRMDLIFEDNTRHDSVLMRHIVSRHDERA